MTKTERIEKIEAELKLLKQEVGALLTNWGIK